MTFLLGPVGDDRLDAVLQRARQQEPSYPGVGATRTGDPPSGYRFDHHHVDIPADGAVGGDPDAAFAAAVRALQRWEAHRGAGVTVFPEDAPLAEGETVVAAMRLVPGPLPLVTMAAPCRVVYATDEPDRFGFGYGTLPGHPELGEEAFHVIRTPDGVRFEIDVFWKPAHPLVRLGGPLSRFVQGNVTQRYLEAVRRAVAAPAE
jgi:uncharacterized protein (UPF0548 family)